MAARFESVAAEACRAAGSPPREQSLSEEAWRDRLRPLEPLEPPTSGEWSGGGADTLELRRGARIVWDLGGDVDETGGSMGWLARADVEADGYMEGWRERLAAFRRVLALDEGGYLCFVNRTDGSLTRVTRETAASSLPPALQAFANARLALGSLPIVRGPPEKDDSRHFLNLDVAQAELQRCMIYQAKFGATALVTLDAAWGVVRGEDGRPVLDAEGKPVKAVGRAVGLHDGDSCGSRGLIRGSHGQH